ncbi:HD domain-containing phosphohydrolase [Candidatus Omnitrophota bacterium]
MPVAHFFSQEPKFLSLVSCLNNLGVGLSVINKEMRIVWTNQVLSNTFGPPESICQRPCYQVFFRRKDICLDCPVVETFRTGEPSQKNSQLHFGQNGQKRYYHLSTTPISYNGKVAEVLELSYDVTKDKALEERIRHKSSELNTALRELFTVYSLSREIISTLDLQKVLTSVARTVCSIIHTKACVLRLVDEDNKQLNVASSSGISAAYLQNTPLKVGQGLSGLMAKSARPVICPDLSKEKNAKYCNYINQEGFQSALGVPIIFKDQVLGTILTYDKLVRNYSRVEVMLLSTFASQVAIAIKNAKLYEKVHLNYFNTLSTLALAMEARDPYTHGHSLRVTAYATEIARALGLAPREIKIILRAGKLHDVGKIAVPDAILMKPGPLTRKEKEVIQLHPLKGVEMLAPLKFLESGFPLIKHHHERFDGRGYPAGLRKGKIPVLARLFSCADAFDAMTSDRPYRCKMTYQTAIGELKKNAGSQFDPDIVKKFVSVLKRKPALFSTLA